jgi:hypothetical protein
MLEIQYQMHIMAMCMLFFCFRTHSRVVYHYIKKKKGLESVQHTPCFYCYIFLPFHTRRRSVHAQTTYDHEMSYSYIVKVFLTQIFLIEIVKVKQKNQKKSIENRWYSDYFSIIIFWHSAYCCFGSNKLQEC